MEIARRELGALSNRQVRLPVAYLRGISASIEDAVNAVDRGDSERAAECLQEADGRLDRDRLRSEAAILCDALPDSRDWQAIVEELCALLARSGRSSDGIVADVLGFRGLGGGASLLDILFPKIADWAVAVPIVGASDLDGFEEMVGGAVLLRARGGRGRPLRDWDGVPTLGPIWTDHAKTALSEFLAAWDPGHAACVACVSVRAIDRSNAARLGVERISRGLHVYSAALRLGRLTLADTVVVVDSTMRRGRRVTLTAGGVQRAYPLATRNIEWLAPTLSVAHALREQQSPVLAAALAWVAIESLGIGSTEDTIVVLSKCLALQVLRQDLIGTLDEVRRGARARSAALELGRAELEDRRRRIANGIEKVRAHGLIEREALLAESMTVVDRKAAALLVELGHDGRRAHALRSLARRFDENAHGRLVDPDDWVGILDADLVSQDAVDVRRRLDTLIHGDLSIGAEMYTRWCQEFARPEVVAAKLTQGADIFYRLLRALYAVRNVTLHRGAGAVASDEVLLAASGGIVDLVLEFLGNWSRHVEQFDAVGEVAREVGGRYDVILDLLESGCRPSALRLGVVTSPKWTRPGN